MKTPTKTKHTPLVLRTVGDSGAVIDLPDGNTIGGVYRGGDEDTLNPDAAAFICQAVNHHVELVEALRDCEAVISKNYDHAYAMNPLVRRCGALNAVRDLRDRARAVLAKLIP